VHPSAALRSLLTIALASLAFAAAAQEFPSRPVKLLVPFGPGSGPDIVARELAPEMSKALGQTVAVENRPGAGGNVAAQALLAEHHDGYTVLLATDSIFTLNPLLFPKSGFDPMTSLKLVTPVSEAALFVVADQSLKVNTFAELVALVKAQPGKINYQAPTGSPHHIIGERLAHALALNWVRVSYRDPQQGLTELLNGLVPVAISTLPFVKAQIDAGKVKPLAVATAQRWPTQPDVPALAETLPGFRESAWFALVAPSDAPAGALDRLNAAALKARDSAALKARLPQLGMIVLDGDARALEARAKAEATARGELIRARGIKAD